jgi:hypothetical protein
MWAEAPFRNERPQMFSKKLMKATASAQSGQS